MIRIGNKRFTPGLWPTLAVLVLLPLLCGLGVWQLARAEQKRELFTQFAAGSTQPDMTLASALATDSPRYKHVRLSGHYLSARQFLLDNMIVNGHAGYMVLTPFALDQGGAVLVNRGWVPLTGERSKLPPIDVTGTPRSVTGRLDRLPRPGLVLQGEGPLPAHWPRVVQFPDMPALAAALETTLSDYQVLLDTQAPDGYVRQWQPAEFGPERHLAYAFQWFGLAVALLVIYIVVNLHRDPEHP